MADRPKSTFTPNDAFRQTMMEFVEDVEVRHTLFQFGNLLDILLSEADIVSKWMRGSRSWLRIAVAGLLGDLDHLRRWLDSVSDCVGESTDPEEVRLALAVTDAAKHFDAFRQQVTEAYEARTEAGDAS